MQQAHRKLIAVVCGLPAAVMVVAISIWSLSGRAVLAEEANPVRERQKMMRAVGKAMKSTVNMLRGKTADDAAAAAANMQTMVEVAGRFPELFPAGSDMENSIMDFDRESDARPEIWKDMAGFKARAADLAVAAEAAKKLSSDKAGFMAAFGAVGKACKACHLKYKADKDNG